jgi:hypothetical protein
MDTMSDQRRDEWPNLDDKPRGTAEGGATGSGGKSDVTGELQELGQRLAATARALWQSEQRQELQQEVTDGLRLLRDQLSGAVDTVRANPKVQTLKDQVGQKVESGRTADTFEDVRAGLAGGLRALNDQLQRFTERLERQDDAAADTASRASAVPPSDFAPSSGATTPEASGVLASDSTPPNDVVVGGPLAGPESAAPKPDLPGAPEGPAAEPRR